MSFFGSIGKALGGIVKPAAKAVGGIIKSSVPLVAHAIPGVSQLYDAGTTLAKLRGTPVGKKILDTPILPLPLPAPGWISQDPTATPITVTQSHPEPVVMTPSRVPMLPSLSGGGLVKTGPWGDVTSHSASTAPPGMGGAGVRGHYTKKGYWSNRRRPRMNPMNVHAGRRAIRRIKSAEKLFHRFLAVSHPGHTGKVHPKRGKR